MQTASPAAAPDARASAEAAALIAEAREHARRRRWRTALAAVIVAAAVGGGLIGAGVFAGSRPVSRVGPPRPVPLPARAGRVTGYIDACRGVAIPGAPPYAAGTVTALRGRQTWKANGPGTYRLQLPATTAARQHVAEGQPFSFDLAAGRYVLVVGDHDGSVLSFVDVTVAAGRVLHQNLPNLCK
jgi:hypothetical protein